MAVTNHFLLGFRSTPQEEAHAQYCKSNQKFMLGELTDSKGEPINNISLGDTVSICPLNVDLYTHKQAQLSVLIREMSLCNG